MVLAQVGPGDGVAPGAPGGGQDARPAHAGGAGSPAPVGLTVLVAIRHPAMRRFTCEILDAEGGCSVVVELERGITPADALARWRPDLVVIDTGEFPECGARALPGFPADRVIVVGPEPEGDYRAAALAHGAGAWISRDRLGEDLPLEVRRMAAQLPGWTAGAPGRPGAHPAPALAGFCTSPVQPIASHLTGTDVPQGKDA
jgi:hypothetical protein